MAQQQLRCSFSGFSLSADFGRLRVHSRLFRSHSWRVSVTFFAARAGPVADGTQNPVCGCAQAGIRNPKGCRQGEPRSPGRGQQTPRPGAVFRKTNVTPFILNNLGEHRRRASAGRNAVQSYRSTRPARCAGRCVARCDHCAGCLVECPAIACCWPLARRTECCGRESLAISG